jgi:hypothetical protein
MIPLTRADPASPGALREGGLQPVAQSRSRPSVEVVSERADPINGLLDLFEAQVKVLIEHGAEFQLRTRIERLLPREEPEPDLFVQQPPPVASDPLPTREPQATEYPAGFGNIDDALGYANAINVATLRARGVREGPSRDQAEAARRFLLAKLAKLKGQP